MLRWPIMVVLVVHMAEHNYIATLLPTGQSLRGTITVRPPRGAWERALDCANGSSERICFMR